VISRDALCRATPYELSFTENVLRLDLPRLRCSQPDRRSQAFNEVFLIKRLAQEADRSVVERTLPVFLVRISGNQNDRRLVSLRPQGFLQFKSIQPWHLQVSDQARCLRDQTRLEEMLSRDESNGFVSQRLDKLADAVTGQRVIIDNRNQRFRH
jgi:hypothetical protein